MNRRRALACAASAALAFVVAAAAATRGWQRLPAAPIAPNEALTSVWTGKQMVVVRSDVARAKDGAIRSRMLVAAWYDPTTHTWRKLQPSGRPSDLGYESVWTGKEVLVWGQGSHEAFNPATNAWRTYPSSPLLSVHDAHGLVVWTGREMIGWGGGCCGDAFSDGVAYNPKTNKWRALPRGPLAGSQDPVGAWSGHELVIFVGNTNPDGKPWPARLARAAVYNPSTNAWRRLAKPPVNVSGATAVWDGRELLVVGAGNGTATYAFSPRANRWRALARMPSRRVQAADVWTGRELLVWGGTSREAPTRNGLAFDPRANRWSTFAAAPLSARAGATAVWTGHAMLVYGGSAPMKPSGTKYFTDGAAFTP
jgi:N-acetylneuraminic acid mutarotase